MTELTEQSVTEKLDTLSVQGRALLLYLEERSVNNCGLVNPAHMNADDFDLAERWAREGFIRFSRVLSCYLDGPWKLSTATHVVELTDVSWAVASLERRRRAIRSQRRDVVQESLKHHESNRAADPELTQTTFSEEKL